MTKKKQQTVSPTTIWLAAIASTLVAILFYAGLFWLDHNASNTTASEAVTAQPEIDRNGLIVISLIMCALVLGPGILVALIVLPIIRKNKKK